MAYISMAPVEALATVAVNEADLRFGIITYHERLLRLPYVNASTSYVDLPLRLK